MNTYLEKNITKYVNKKCRCQSKRVMVDMQNNKSQCAISFNISIEIYIYRQRLLSYLKNVASSFSFFICILKTPCMSKIIYKEYLYRYKNDLQQFDYSILCFEIITDIWYIEFTYM